MEAGFTRDLRSSTALEVGGKKERVLERKREEKGEEEREREKKTCKQRPALLRQGALGTCSPAQ